MSRPASLRYHIAQLGEICRSHPVAEKVVFVPSNQIGYNLGTALSRAGVSWINLHLTTTASWAERIVGPELRGDGYRPLVQDAEHFFMLRSIRRAPWPSGHPFARTNPAPGLADSFLRTVRGLRLAGVDPSELSQVDIVLEGGGVFIDLYRDYCTWLEGEKLYDHAMLYQRAAAVPPDGKTQIAMLDETPLPETAYRFVRSLGGRVLRIGREDYGVPAPQHAARMRFPEVKLVAHQAGTVGIGGHVRLDGDAGDVALREAVGAENEVRGAIREIVSEGASLDQIEIAYTAEDPYLGLLVDAMDRWGLPASYAAGVPVTLTATGQAVVGFYRWVASGFEPAELLRLLRGRHMFAGMPKGDEDLLETPTIASVLSEARVGRGRSGWIDALRRLHDRIDSAVDNATEGRAAYARRHAALVRRSKVWVESLLEIVPDRDSVSLAEAAETGVAFIRQFTILHASDRERRAAESLTDRLDKLRESGSSDGSLRDLARSLAQLISEHKIEAAIARPGELYVVPLDRAGYTGREHTVIVGLAEATFPGPAIEDPILLDDERERIAGGRLALQRIRASEPIWHFIRVLGAAAGAVLLTANRRELSEGRETYPAAVFEQLKQQGHIKHPTVYGIVPASNHVLTEDEAALVIQDRGAVASLLLDERPWLSCGLASTRGRSSIGFGPFDGWLGYDTPELRPGGDAALSASRLEQLAACPYRYFLRNVLQVRPPDEPEDLPGRWLTPLEFGSLLHDVLRNFMEMLSKRGERVDAERHGDLMKRMLDEAVARMRDKVPVRTESGYRSDVRRLRRSGRVFLTEESRRTVRPVGFEVGFGMGRNDGLSVVDPVRVRLTESVELRLVGSIDRVDEAEDGYEVWDYKTGSGYRYDEFDLIAGGRRLQWALYAFVLEELLVRSGRTGKAVRSGYFFTGDREHGLRLEDAPPAREEVGRLLAPLFEMATRGAFLKVQSANECTFCDYRSICASERVGAREAAAAIEASADLPFADAVKTWMEA